jgi:hypothetical protein
MATGDSPRVKKSFKGVRPRALNKQSGLILMSKTSGQLERFMSGKGGLG